MFATLRAKGAELITGVIIAIVGAMVGGLLALAGTYWQSIQSEHQIQQEAIKGFINDYAGALVEIEYFGNKRVPVPTLTVEEKAALRKEVRGVYAACSRLVLVVPDLGAPATVVRDLLVDWEKAIDDREPYGTNRQARFMKDFDSLFTQFLGEAKTHLNHL